MIQFRLLSLSHQKTDITIRERFALNTTDIKELLTLFKSNSKTTECCILSTCNRTEILYVAKEDCNHEILSSLCKIKNQDLTLAKEFFTSLSNEEMVLSYLFRVSSGLESQILGDAQIISQFKSAYELAKEAETAGTYIHRLMHVIFAANKKITSQTGFRSGISSAPYAAVDMISEYQNMLKSPKIAIIGFGDMGQNVCRHLISQGCTDLTVINRSQEKLELFNQKNKTHIQYIPIEEINKSVDKYDIIISTPSVQTPILHSCHFKNGTNLFKVMVDISIPRSIAPEVGKIPGIVLYDMNDISQVTKKTLAQKKECIGAVEEILNDHLAEFLHWKQDNKNLQVIRNMKTALQTMKLEELDRFQKQGQLEDAGNYEQIMDAMIQKIIKKTVVTMKSLKDDKEKHLYNSMITQTFL
ncbi:glutamyl-tRNA reductase [Echinicola marina]|uniref:glutamyl-tRNA reductase n=1 Tax=Echinicola marina TaxID=2859768 RepID=UPI001CF64FD2|nr:glutamyl-tRNA reductase [Echinicola marina]UCS91549.1 glutamyl-tRNA reductase [Echinicola marina]